MRLIKDKELHDQYCNTCIEGPHSPFHELDDNSKSLLRQTSLCRSYKKGDHIYEEGNLPVGLICLISGKVKITKKGITGRNQIVRMAKPVGFIGYRAFFAEENHIASAEALEDSIVCIMKTELVIGIVRSNSNFAMNIIRALATDLGFSNRRTVTLTQKHIRGRLAESILVLRETYGCEKDDATLKVYLSREDLANLSNMTTSNAIRTLSNFAAEGVLELNGKAIKVIDWDLLEHISHLG
jgi:CRP-like cAMP-binding protein